MPNSRPFCLISGVIQIQTFEGRTERRIRAKHTKSDRRKLGHPGCICQTSNHRYPMDSNYTHTVYPGQVCEVECAVDLQIRFAEKALRPGG